MTPNQKLVQAKVNEVLQKALDLYGKSYPRVKFHLGMMPQVTFDIRGYRMAGQARRDANGFLSVRFHPKAVEEQLDEMLNNVVAHEIAHLVCYAEPTLGRKHNLGWQAVCFALGGNGKRCGSMNLGIPSPEKRRERSLALRPHVYTDTTGIARRVTTRVHNRIRRGAVYRYRNSGGTIGASSPYRYERHVQAAVVHKAVLPATQPDLGGKSKADIARALIKIHYGQMSEPALITLIAQKAGLSAGLAKKYFSNNLAKAFMS